MTLRLDRNAKDERAFIHLYDIIVVGAGPSGSQTSYLLAKENYRVLLLDKGPGKKICTGIVSDETFQKFAVDRACVIRPISSIDLISPSSFTFQYRHPSPFAHVTDRDAFDYFLLNRAREAGVECSLDSLVRDVRTKEGGVEVLYDNGGEKRMVRARILVLALGLNAAILRKLGFEPPPSLTGIQAEVDFEGEDRIKVYLGRDIAPASFAWFVPLGNGRARIGLTTNGKARDYFNRFLELPYIKNGMNGQAMEISSRPIPYGMTDKTYGQRILLVGDAAGQTKTTTGGGIHYGLIGAEAASRVIQMAFSKGDFTETTLGLYEEAWKREFSSEIETGIKLREMYSKLKDTQVDNIVKFANKDGVAALIRNRAKFDWHKSFFLHLLRNQTICRLLSLPQV